METTTVAVGADEGRFGTAGTRETTKKQVCEGSINLVDPGTWYDEGPICLLGGTAICREADYCEDGSVAQRWVKRDDATDEVLSVDRVCPRDPKQGPTLVDIQNEFKTVELPASVVVVQPPEGETLVNLATILSTEAADFTAERPVVGVTVTFRIHPASFGWHHGDGTKQGTVTPGSKWHENIDETELITHTYDETASGLAVSVDTTWSADYSEDDGKTWKPVGVTVTKTGDADARLEHLFEREWYMTTALLTPTAMIGRVREVRRVAIAAEVETFVLAARVGRCAPRPLRAPALPGRVRARRA